MSKLTKAQAKSHDSACKLLAKENLSLDEKYFVLEHWCEDANHVNSVAGAFFTPVGLARDLSIEVVGPRIIDLCAGIGTLAFTVWHHRRFERDSLSHLTCVEINPDYVAVGKKVLPEATWILADVFALPVGLGHFDCAISNPPFGATKASGKGPRFAGNVFEYRVIDLASDIADYGVFIVPQLSAPFEFSGIQSFRWNESDRYRDFRAQTSIALAANCGLDTSMYRGDWHGVAPAVEIVTSDFHEARVARTVARTSSQRFIASQSSTAQSEPLRERADGGTQPVRQFGLFEIAPE